VALFFLREWREWDGFCGWWKRALLVTVGART
jgi:hypothetical protein